MSEYSATIVWQRQNQQFLDRRYSRAHQWKFDGGLSVPASSSPSIVPIPMSDGNNVDPEEAFVASLSSCHMLFFLDFACREGWIVDCYEDKAVGHLGKDQEGRLVMTDVVLRPNINFADNQPDEQVIANLHHLSHQACFIANSVKTKVTVE